MDLLRLSYLPVGIVMCYSIRCAALQQAVTPPPGKSDVCHGHGIGSWTRTLPFDVLWVEKAGATALDDEA
jgi:hypothetical protein